MDKLELLFAALSAKLSALKKALSDEQLEIYDAEIERIKQSFLESHSSLSPELLDYVEKLFS